MVPHGEGEANGSLKSTVKSVSHAQVRGRFQLRGHFFQVRPGVLELLTEYLSF